MSSRLAATLATLLIGSFVATSALAESSCPANRMITASGTDAPGSPTHIYYIFPDAGEIQEGLSEPEPIKVTCREGEVLLRKKSSGDEKACEFRFRYNSTNTGASLTEISPANCESLQLTNLKWAAPVPGKLSEKKMVYALWVANDSAIRFTSLVVGIARDGGVRSLADEMKTEHGDLNNKLASTFADLHVNWSESPPPKGVTSDVSLSIYSAAERKRTAMLQKAAAKRLNEVDKQFVMDEYKFHTKMVKTIEKFKETKNDTLKSFVDESLETFKKHIAHAEMLAAALGISQQAFSDMRKQSEPFPSLF